MVPSIITDHKGPILVDIRPMVLWATITWSDGTESMYQELYLRCAIDQFFIDILTSNFIQELSQIYSRPGHTISAGPFLGTTGLRIKTGGPKNNVPDSAIQSAIEADHIAGILPWPTPETCYFVFIPTDANVVLPDGTHSKPSSNPKDGSGGYHNWFLSKNNHVIFYCVITPPTEDKDELTTYASHELAEVITDPIAGEGFTGPPNPHDGRLPEISDMCSPKQASVSGYYVSTYIKSGSSPTDISCGPTSDEIPSGISTTASIKLEPSFTKLSCWTGSIIAGQSVFFHAEAFYYRIPTIITTLQWSTNPNGTALQETEGNQGREFSIIIPYGYGMKSFDVQVYVTTILGCVIKVKRTFNIVTQDEANAEESLCAAAAAVRKAMQGEYKLPFPRNILPDPPPWDIQRDFSRNPLTLAELNNIDLLGKRLVEFARIAKPLVRSTDSSSSEDIRELG